MKPKGFKKFAALAAAALLCCSAIFGSTARAQTCPTFPLDCNTWTSATQTFTMSGGCKVQVTFCYECCKNVIETVLQSVLPVGSTCTGSTPQDWIDFAAQQASLWAIGNYEGGGGGCDVKTYPCTSQVLVCQLYSKQCWELNNIVGKGVYIWCPGDTCYCQTSYDACWDKSTNSLVTSNFVTNDVGTCVCTPPPPPGTAWTPGVCYDLACPDGNGGHI